MSGKFVRDLDGEILRHIGVRTTTPHRDEVEKPVDTDSSTIEVIISDSRLVSRGSQWGHVAITIEGTTYGMSHNGYDARAKEKYLSDNAFRDNIGVELRASLLEIEKMRLELVRRKAIGEGYNVVANNCSTNVADVLESIGILAHDPRFFFAPDSTAGVTPKELLIVISRSKRFVKTHEYLKK